MTSNDDSQIQGPFKNTDKELWREDPGNYYSPSLHVTVQGNIGINVGGLVIIMPARSWHELAMKDMKCACGSYTSDHVPGCGE